MNRDDADLDAVRELVAAVHGPAVEPSADTIARTWARVSTRARPRVRWRWLALPAAAAAVVAVVAATSVLLRPQPGAEVGAPGPGTPTTSSATPAPPSTPPPDLGTVVRPLPVATVVAAMVQRAASVAPLTIPAGKLLYVRTNGSDGRAVHEMWLDPQGMVPQRIVVDGQDMGAGERLPGGPTLRSPTPQWLAGLSTDPGTLLDMLKALNRNTELDPGHYVLKELHELYWICGPLLTPPVRAAFYRVLLNVDKLSAFEIRLGGHTLYEIRRQKDYGADDLLLDPSTGQVVGSRIVWLGPPSDGMRTGDVSGIELWHHAVVTAVGQTG